MDRSIPLRRERPKPRGSLRSGLGRSALLAGFVSVVALAAALALGPLGEPQHVAFARQAESLLEQAQNTRDTFQAHSLAANALVFAQKAAAASPTTHAALLQRTDLTLRAIDRAFLVEPTPIVHLGSSGNGLVDLAASDDAIYALDVEAGNVIRFDTTTPDQGTAAPTILAQAGHVVGGKPLDTPVAIAYVPGTDRQPANLTIVDRGRAVVQFTEPGTLSRRSVSGTSEWRRIAALASLDDTLYVLDGDLGQLVAYGGASSSLNRPPTLVIDARNAPGVPFGTSIDLLPVRNLFFRDGAGSVTRFDWQGRRLPFDVRPPDAPLGPVAGMVSDGNDGLYLADPLQKRIVHVTAEGRLIRQLRSSGSQSFATLRAIQPSSDGNRLFGLTRDAIVSISLPSEIPTPMEITAPPDPNAPAPASTTVVK